MKGGYVLKEMQYVGCVYCGCVDVFLVNVEDVSDLLLMLWYEVLGYYGVNIFVLVEKCVLLDGLVVVCEEFSFKLLWDDIDWCYVGYFVDLCVEEVFVLYCEGIELSYYQGVDFFVQGIDQVWQKGQQLFVEICIVCVWFMQVDDLYNIVCVVVQGLYD